MSENIKETMPKLIRKYSEKSRRLVIELEKVESDAQMNCCWARQNMPIIPETNPKKTVAESPLEIHETPPSRLGRLVIMLG